MRYRPFGKEGAAASAVSLALTDEPMRPSERLRLIYAALEAGINTFEIRSADPEVAIGLADALESVDRGMVLIVLRLGWVRDRRGARVRDLGPDAVRGAIDQVLAITGFGYIDMVVVDLVEDERLPPHIVPHLHYARDAGLVRLVAMAGTDAVDAYIGKTDFDALVTPFHILSGWVERNRLRRAVQADMPIIGCDYHPADLGGQAAAAEAEPLRRAAWMRWLTPRRAASRIPSAYDFLRWTQGWTPEQICLAYALTEPCLGSIQTTLTNPDQLAELAAVTERDLPNGLAAQIEMARFSADQQRGALAKRRQGA